MKFEVSHCAAGLGPSRWRSASQRPFANVVAQPKLGSHAVPLITVDGLQ